MDMPLLARTSEEGDHGLAHVRRWIGRSTRNHDGHGGPVSTAGTTFWCAQPVASVPALLDKAGQDRA